MFSLIQIKYDENGFDKEKSRVIVRPKGESP